MLTREDRIKNGKRNVERSRIVSVEKKRLRMDAYIAQPTLCNKCSTPLDYLRRKHKFCSHSCAASYNNLGVPRHGRRIKRNCEVCDKKLVGNQKKFCSNTCCGKHTVSKTADKIKVDPSSVSIGARRKYLHATRPNVCEICKGDTWMGKPMPLVMDHIDGNPANDALDNLRLICPNCDRQTPTFGSRNRGNGRKSRGIYRG